MFLDRLCSEEICINEISSRKPTKKKFTHWKHIEFPDWIKISSFVTINVCYFLFGFGIHKHWNNVQIYMLEVLKFKTNKYTYL